MRAVLYRMRSVIRSRMLATVTVTLIVAVVCGVVIAFAAGARRTSTAPDRYTATFGGGFDAMVRQGDFSRPLDREVAALPGVASVEAMTFVFGGLVDSNGNGLDFSLVFIGSPRGTGEHLVDGRLADPGNAHEFVANRGFVETSHARIGDTFELVTLTHDQARDVGFAMDDPQGPRVPITLVGVLDGAGKLEDPTPLVVVSRAMFGEGDIGVADSLMAVDMRPGVDLTTLRAQLDTLPGHEALSLEPGVLISDPIRNAVSAQARGLWILAAVAAIAAVAVLGQVITRQVRLAQGERERLSAIGFTQGQLLADAVGRAVIPITIGSLLGAALACLPSGYFPSGFVRVLEPNPGLHADWDVMLGGAALFVVALMLWTLAALVLSTWAVRPAHPSPVVEAVATRATSATAATGVRLAFTHGARDRGTARGSVVGVVLSIAGLVAAITFGVSLDRLVHQPFRYGSNFDASVGNNGANTVPEGLVERLDSNPDVTALTLFAGSQARVGDRTVPMLGVEAVRGEGQPTVIAGRLPVSEDEIAFGRLTARDIDVGVGDDVTMVGLSQTQVFRVTGIAVVPGLGSNDGLGDGGIVTMGGLTRLDETALPTDIGVDLRVSREEFYGSLPEYADLPVEPEYVPSAIVNVSRIRAIPFVLGGVLAALALLTVSHAMVTSMRSRRRDLAILRSLGADRGWITRAVHWQATLLTAVPVVIGIPAGLVVGRLVFAAFADSMGAVNDAAIPVAIVAIGSVAVVAIANAIAGVISRTGRRHEPALLLQSE
jgi:FtsX-like permease family